MALGTPTAPTPAVVGGPSITSITSAEFTPAANSLLFVHLTTRKSGAGSTEPTIGDNSGGMFLWQSLTTSVNVAGGVALRQRVYVAATGAAPPAVQVSLNSVDTVRMSMQFAQITGSLSVPVNFILNLNATGNPSCVLPLAPAATSTLIGFYVLAKTSAGLPTVPSGFTQLEEKFDAGAQLQLQSCYDELSGAQTNAWTSGSAFPAFGTMIEVRSPLLARSRAIWTG
jgi:hypothetical protein